jgi:UDP-2,3-diacylglucosamine pyrophosphatase LpxH
VLDGTSSQTDSSNNVRSYRTVFISDIHLGSAGCQTEAITGFIKGMRCEKLYLVGDIIDGWVGSRETKWTQDHNDVVRAILEVGRFGTEIFYTPGNPDAFLRKVLGTHLGNMSIDHSFAHQTADGKNFLIVHGDQYDRAITKYMRWAYVGAWGHEWMTLLNVKVNNTKLMQSRQVNFASALKRNVKRVIKSRSGYVEDLISDAKEEGFDGVVCGHIHKPTITETEGIIYVNAGDWVEHCTAVVEHFDGRLELIHYADWSLATSNSSGAIATRS